MLPKCRAQEDVYDIPKFDITKQDVNSFMGELKAFHEAFSGCFLRSESRGHFFRYMVGQFSDIERKSIEPIAIAVEEGGIRAMQRFVSDAVWDEEKILYKYRNMVNEDLGDPQGVLIFDETGFPKKGEDSAGVARQYCGALGKVDNCQVGVFASYASPHGYALVDKRLFIAKKWFSEPFEARRMKCKMPDNLDFQSKPQMAAAMLQGLAKEGILPFKHILADELYGDNPHFIEAAEQIQGASYFVAVSSDALCWLNEPITRKKRYKYRGRIREKTVLETTEKTPIRVDEIARSLNDFFWYRRTVSEGAKGPIVYEFTKRRIVLARNGLPTKALWLIIRRTLGENPIYSYYLSNAPMSSRLPLFVWLSGLRWAIEQCFEETKTELGMDHYEVRKYKGRHHHILTCMLAHFFLWHLKLRLGKKSTVHYSLSA